MRTKDLALKRFINVNRSIERFVLVGHSGGSGKTAEVVTARGDLLFHTAWKLKNRHSEDRIFSYPRNQTRRLVEIAAMKESPGPMDDKSRVTVSELDRQMSPRDAFLFFKPNRVLVDTISRVGASGSPLFGCAGLAGPFQLVARFVRGFPESALFTNQFLVEQAVYCRSGFQ